MDDSKPSHHIQLLAWIAAVAFLSTAFFAIRFSGTNELVTNDEPFWLGRSANFSRAISTGDLEHTYQMAHPGVTVMWAGSIAFWLHAPEYASPDPGNTDWPFFIDERLVQDGIDPLTILQQARIVKLLMETALFAGSVFLIASVGSKLLALITGMLIGLDPFLVGFGPLLHVDSLFAMSLFTATLAAIWAFTGREKSRPVFWRCLLAGSIASLAVLTRFTGLVIAIPMMVIVSTSWLQNRSHSIRMFRTLCIGTVAWLTGFVATFLAAWPALWVAPFDTIRTVLDWTFGAASGGHEYALFFDGQIITDDPGFWFYPVTLLWRTTPIVWIGVLLGIISLRNRSARRQAHKLLPIFMLGAAVLVMMSFGAKKFDRYILPVYPAISLFAAIGFVWLINHFRSRLPNLARWTTPGILTVIMIASSLSLVSSGAHHLNYYNGVMKLTDRPENAIQIGWGEGGSEVIRFLEVESARLGRPVVVQTFSIPQESIPPPLKYFLYVDGELSNRVIFQNVGLNAPEDWLNTDYFAFNLQQTQRDMVPEYSLFENIEPAYVVTYNGVDIWEVYPVSELPVPDLVNWSHDSPSLVSGPRVR